jgi:hypothetical protein
MDEIFSTFTDSPIGVRRDDRLQYSDYAGFFSRFFLLPGTPTPLTMAISGPWGVGKTSLAYLMKDNLEDSNVWSRHWSSAPLTCWFNAWHHTDAENIGVALTTVISRVLSPYRPLWRRIFQPLPIAYVKPTRRWIRRPAQSMTITALLILISITYTEYRPAWIEHFKTVSSILRNHTESSTAFLILSLAIAISRKTFKLGSTIGEFLESPSEAASKGVMADVREYIGIIINPALHTKSSSGAKRRLVVFIDDLERCPPDKALGLCEVVSQLLDHEGLIVVLISDLLSLEKAAASRHRENSEDSDAEASGGRYLDKLIQLRWTLPPLRTQSVLNMFPEGESNDQV